jgi:hypothetical protein
MEVKMNNTTLLGIAYTYQYDLRLEAEQARLAIDAEQDHSLFDRLVAAFAGKLIQLGLYLQAHADHSAGANRPTLNTAGCR